MRKLNKGFTIVELIIVIAVIAVLASVLIPTFINVYNNAQISADTQNAAGVNSLIFAESALGEEPSDIQAVNDILQNGGLSFSSLVAQNKNAIFVWDNASKQIVYLDSNFNLIYSSKKYDAQAAELWLPVESLLELDKFSQTVNCYLTQSDSVENLQLDFGLIVAEGVTLTGDITVKSGANITLGGNIKGNVYVNDGTVVNTKNDLNLFYPLLVEQVADGEITPTYAATNGQIENGFAKVGVQINVAVTVNEGFVFGGFDVGGINFTQQNNVWTFIMPQSAVKLKANFIQTTAQPEVTLNGITYTLKSDGVELFYEVTDAVAEEITTQNGILILEEKIGEYQVKSISNSALADKGLTHVIVPESIAKIGSLAFANNVGLKTVVFLADSIYFVEGDVVDFEIYPFLGCFLDGEDYQNPQITIYYTATTNKTLNWLNYASSYDSAEDTVTFYKANSVTENWVWQDNTLTVDGIVILPESTDSQPDDGTDGGDNNDDTNTDDGNDDDDTNTDDGSNGNDDNATPPETPQTFTVTVVFNPISEYSTKYIFTLNETILSDDNLNYNHNINCNSGDVISVSFNGNKSECIIKINEETYIFECSKASGSAVKFTSVESTAFNTLSEKSTTTGEISITSDITITINY